MRKLVISLVACIALATPAKAQFSRAQLLSYFSGATGTASATNCWPTNGVGSITALTMRQCMINFLDSTLLFENVASVAQIWHAVANQVIDTVGAQMSLLPSLIAASSSTYTPDLNLGINFVIGFSASDCASCTLADMAHPIAGTSGTIWLEQPSSGGPVTLSYGSTWKFPGGTPPTLSTGASAIDKLTYDCLTTTFCTLDFGADYK